MYTNDYVVEINNDNGFVRQVAGFNSYDEADGYVNAHSGTDTDCKKNEFYNIICIEYDDNGDEVGFHSVV